MVEEKKKPDGVGTEAKVGVVYLTVFLDFFASGVVLPLLQTHARKELGATGFNVGMVFTAYSLASMVGSFIMGRLSDKIGRRPIILLSLLMSSVTLYLTAIAPTLDMLIKARALAGFFSETSVCQAYIADKTSLEDRSRYLGHMGAFIGLGFMVGPAVGAMLGAFGGFPFAAYFTTVVTALNFLYAYAKLDESLGTSKQTPAEAGEGSWGAYFSALFRPRFLLTLLAQFASTCAFMGWNTTFGLWAAERLYYERKHTGWALAWLAAALVLAMWKMRLRIKNAPGMLNRANIFGNLLCAASLYLHTWIGGTLSLLVPLFLLGFGYGVADLVYQSIVSLSTSKQLQ
eukprot:gene11576-17830_t